MGKEQKYEMKPSNGKVVELQFEGRMAWPQLEFMAEIVKKYKINKTTLNLDASVAVWNLNEEGLQGLLADAKRVGVPTCGAYSFKKRKVFYSPLSGLEENEYLDVRPYAEAARAWIDEQEGNAKFTVYFSNGGELPKEAYRCDVIFQAAEGGLMRVFIKKPGEEGYFQLAENTEAGRCLPYLKIAFALKGKTDTEAAYRMEFWKTLGGMSDEERSPVEVELPVIDKTGNGEFTCGPKIIKQKQPELYAVTYHPLGGVINVAFWNKLVKVMKDYKQIELRLDPRMNLYVCNLLAEEVHLPLDAMTDGAYTAVERSMVRSYCGLCHFGNCDAQMFEHVILKELRKMNFSDGTLPTFTFTGCYRACGWIPATELRFLAREREAGQQGLLFDVQSFGDEEKPESLGIMPQKKIVEYLIALGALAQSADLSFKEWSLRNTGLLKKVTELYCQEEEK